MAMTDEAAQERGAGGDREERLLGAPAQDGGILRGEVGQVVGLGMRPDQLDGIEFWSVRRERMHIKVI